MNMLTAVIVLEVLTLIVLVIKRKEIRRLLTIAMLNAMRKDKLILVSVLALAPTFAASFLAFVLLVLTSMDHPDGYGLHIVRMLVVLAGAYSVFYFKLQSVKRRSALIKLTREKNHLSKTLRLKSRNL